MITQKNNNQSKKVIKLSNNVVFTLHNYANKIIQLQALLENNYSLILVQQLSNLYRIGIQNYAIKEPKKAAYIKKKLINLLGDEQCLQILENQNKRKRSMQSQAIKKKNLMKQNPQTSRTNCSQSSELNKFDLLRINIITPNDNQSPRKQINSQLKSQMESADNQLKNLVQNSQKIAIRSSELKQKQFQKQQLQLKERINVKKMKKQRKISFTDQLSVSQKQIC